MSPLLTPVSLWSGRLLIGWEDTERCHVSLRAQLASYQLVPVVNMELNPHRLVSRVCPPVLSSPLAPTSPDDVSVTMVT